MRASSCDSFGVLLAEQMKSMSTSNDNNAKNNTNTIAAGADLRIPRNPLYWEKKEKRGRVREKTTSISTSTRRIASILIV